MERSISNYICVSHGERIRSIIRGFYLNKEENNSKLANMLNKEGNNSNLTNMNKLLSNITNATKCPGFMNCAIIKFNIKQGQITISLVHEGELDQPRDKQSFIEQNGKISKNFKNVKNVKNIEEQKKYVLTNFRRKYIEFTPTTFSLNETIKSKFNNDIEYNIYFIRHGQGIHNLNPRLQVLFDTDLTTTGCEQGIRAGKAFRKKVENISNFKIYVSDLIRTRQTLENFLIGYYNRNLPYTNQNTLLSIIVNPFLHELHLKGVKANGNLEIKDNHEHNCNLIQSYSNKTGYQCGDEENPMLRMYRKSFNNFLIYDWTRYFIEYDENFRRADVFYKQFWYDFLTFMDL